VPPRPDATGLVGLTMSGLLGRLPPMTKLTASELDHLSEAELQSRLIPELLPRHIAVIMDGNGRWAELRGLARMAGHTEGIKSVREIITLCRELGIAALTIYAFSQENWKRPIPEINALMLLLEQYLQSEMDALIEKGARFRAIGRVNSLPPSALNWVRKVERETAHLDKLMLTVALSYGGRSEIVDAVRRLAQDSKDGRVQPDQIDEPLLESYLSTQGLPDPDLLIRTSGEARISNFLLWQLAYTEMYFTPTLWPDFRRREALIALLEYQQRERRFGQVSGAVYPPSGL
jgi:undecaprenyl diphosphate synthase